MCGIAGYLERDQRPAAAKVVDRMVDAIRHRGPDGRGVYCDGPLGLGHARLAIIDLSPSAHQPMATPDGRFVISYNGEIYNYRELQTKLEAMGHQFHSTSDTEVLLHALAAWGRGAVPRLNGMFAFALWDRDEQMLLLARDRYGVKPLYYAQQNGAVIFGSEVKALLQHPDVPARMDTEGLFEYFTFQNFFTDRTLFQGVRLLPPGHTMTVNARTGETKTRQFWDFAFHEPESPGDDREYEEELDRLFTQAVQRQLVSDVEVGCYLSGGMDSGSITALARASLPHLKTFTGGFDLSSASGLEMAFDERAKAEFLSYKLGTEQYEMVLKAGDMERVLPELCWHIEEPRVGQSYPNYYIARLASKFVKVVLSGAGGDELFAGYPWRYYRAMESSSFDHYIDGYHQFWSRLIPPAVVSSMFAPMASEVAHVSTRNIFRGVFGTHAEQFTRPEDYLNHSLYFEAKTFLHGLLVIEDKLSMAHGLESRIPFLDNDLVDFAQRVPVRLKLAPGGPVRSVNENDGLSKQLAMNDPEFSGKRILRRVMNAHLPDQFVNGRKQGFSAPDASWFRGESIDYVRRVLFDKRANIYNYLDPAVVRDLVNEHLDGKQNRRLLIWSLLSVEHFCRSFLS